MEKVFLIHVSSIHPSIHRGALMGAGLHMVKMKHLSGLSFLL
jgi:hypothetical protein